MRVGTSGGATSIMGASGDHPHACGDKFCVSKLTLTA